LNPRVAAPPVDREAFVARYGSLFEHSPWVAEGAWARRPSDDREAVFAAMVETIRAAPQDEQLALIRAHPDLAGRAAVEGTLTPDSTREQASAGLDRLTPEEHARFTGANAAYRERFGFPFVICVREHDKASILAAAEERLRHDREREIEIALAEIEKIARLRLEDLQ
jgi:2-oxo-4-hydroxy-4-carboxy-5-ureidoimidazoline decarboxylase